MKYCNRKCHIAGSNLLLFLAGWFLSSQSNAQDLQPAKDTFAEILKTEAEGMSADGINEILQIRKQLGGGTGLELETILGCSNNLIRFDPATRDGEPVHRPNAASDSSLPATAVSRIRRVARQLDEMAADLEDVELYEHADDLRVKADSLRRQARNTTRSARATGTMTQDQ